MARTGGKSRSPKKARGSKRPHGKARPKKWIQTIPLKKGALHRSLGIPLDQKIPLSLLHKAAKAPGKLGQRARFALRMRGFKHSAQHRREHRREHRRSKLLQQYIVRMQIVQAASRAGGRSVPYPDGRTPMRFVFPRKAGASAFAASLNRSDFVTANVRDRYVIVRPV